MLRSFHEIRLQYEIVCTIRFVAILECCSENAVSTAGAKLDDD